MRHLDDLKRVIRPFYIIYSKNEWLNFLEKIVEWEERLKKLEDTIGKKD